MNSDEMEKELLLLRTRVMVLEKRVEELEENMEIRETSVDRTAVGSFVKKQEVPKKRKLTGRFTEAFVGKYALPVAATLMILTGIAVLSLMTWDYIPDVGKAFLVFLFACLCGAAGFFFGKKETMRLFRQAMVSIAMAVCYTDIVVMHWSWGLLSQLAAIALIAGWCMAGIAFSVAFRVKYPYVILQTGTVVTAMIATELIEPNVSGVALMLCVIAIFLVMVVSYRMMFREGHWTFLLSGMWECTVLASAVPWQPQMEIRVTALLMCGILLVFLCMLSLLSADMTCAAGKTTRLLASVWCCLAIPFVIGQISSAVETPWMQGLGSLLRLFVWVAALFCLVAVQRRQNRNVLSFFTYPCMMYYVAVLSEETGLDYVGLAVLAAGFLLAAKHTKKQVDTIQFLVTDAVASLVFLFLAFLQHDELQTMVFGCCLLLLNVGILWWQHFCYDGTHGRELSGSMVCLLANMFAMGMALAFRYYRQEEWIAVITMMLITAAFSGFMLWKQRLTGKTSKVFLCVVGAFINLMLVIVCFAYENAFLCLIALAHVASVFYLSGSLTHQRTWKDMVFSLISTLNLIALLLNTPVKESEVLLTLGLMVAAVLSVLGGFSAGRKGLRIYGLMLMILCVLKMTLFDVAEQDSITKVFAFLAGGILCLGISYAYNKAEKKMEKKKE